MGEASPTAGAQQPDLFLGFAQRGVQQARVVRLGLAPRKRDLPGVGSKSGRTLDEEQPRILMRTPLTFRQNERQHGCVPQPPRIWQRRIDGVETRGKIVGKQVHRLQ